MNMNMLPFVNMQCLNTTGFHNSQMFMPCANVSLNVSQFYLVLCKITIQISEIYPVFDLYL